MPQLPHRTLMLPGPAGRLEALLWSLPEREPEREQERGEGMRPPLAAVARDLEGFLRHTESAGEHCSAQRTH